MIYGFKCVVCEPYRSKAPEVKSEGGLKRFEYIASRNLLVPLKVVYETGDGNFWPGDIVYVKHSEYASTTEWAKEVEVEGESVDGQPRKVVLVPIEAVKLVKKVPEK